MLSRFVLCAFSIFMLLAVPEARAQAVDDSVIGTILEVEGTATVTPQGQPAIAAAVNGSIHMNDRIETGPQSRVFILLIDDTKWTLSENTKFTVDDYVFDPDNNKDNKGRYSILQGAFQYVSGLIAKKPEPDVQIETPAGSIGIRGTDLTGGDVDGEYGIEVDEGAVDVKTDAGQVRVNQGEGTTIRGRQFAPGRPGKFSAERRQFLQQRVFLKRRDMVQQRMAKMQERHQEMRQRFKQYQQSHPRGQLQQQRQEFRQQKMEQRQNLKQNLQQNPRQGLVPQQPGQQQDWRKAVLQQQGQNGAGPGQRFLQQRQLQQGQLQQGQLQQGQQATGQQPAGQALTPLQKKVQEQKQLRRKKWLETHEGQDPDQQDDTQQPAQPQQFQTSPPQTFVPRRWR